MLKTLVALPVVLLAGAGLALAADPAVTLPETDQPDPIAGSTLRGSIGLRYWNSSATSDVSVHGKRTLNSESRPSHSAEIVGEINDMIEGTFFRAYAGLGRNFDGKQSLRGYSANGHKASEFGYAVVDGGWTLAGSSDGPTVLRGFIGYHFLQDEFIGVYRGTERSLQSSWHAIRLGLSATGQLTDKISWSADVAAVPWAYNKPKHAVSAYTYGIEADALVNVSVTENWRIGAGARYWWLQSRYKGKPSAEQLYRRFGLLAQSSYSF